MEKIQLHYQPLEDRLLLLIKAKDKDEIRLWLTRRVTQRLLLALDALVAKDTTVTSQDNETRKAHVQQFQREQAAEKSQFAKEKIDLRNQEQMQDAKLVADVRLDGKMLRLPMSNKQVLNVELSTQLAYVVTNLINTALPQTAWNLAQQEQQSSIDYMHQSYPTMRLN